ncbi:cupin domain-containing protein [Undibacterium sp.]|jgi:quercetin dioxygenase-like cupin family protein|uniref:cupin domain-containing protein n=1 Tax=Undibacterium sp. TaxID=1914977 RepID=UPI002BB1FBFF|nr:cupin domain-containing protein [Undibacterium sp.]HTD05861.1 cupin domain-containing protein [Undibacterium sp.]
MNVTRFIKAQPYFPPNHDGMHCLRLQGHEAGPSDQLWLGVSHLLPGGGTGMDASPVEKMYVVLSGTITVITEDGETELEPYDSCRLAPGEKRQLKNRSNSPASVLLAMPYPAGAAQRPQLAFE